jgi:hypothetical protein
MLIRPLTLTKMSMFEKIMINLVKTWISLIVCPELGAVGTFIRFSMGTSYVNISKIIIIIIIIILEIYNAFISWAILNSKIDCKNCFRIVGFQLTS